MNLRQTIQVLCDRALCGAARGRRPGRRARLRRRGLVVPAVPGRRRVRSWSRPGWREHLAAGRMPLLKSPLTALGVLALGLGVVQLAPLPASLARRLSPAAARGLYAAASYPHLAHADDPEAALPEAPGDPVAGQPGPVGDRALADRRRGLPGDLLGRLPLHRPPRPAVPGLGVRGRGVLPERGPGDGADHEPERGAVRLLRAGGGPRLGALRSTTCWTRRATAVLRDLGRARRAEPARAGRRPVPAAPFLIGTMMGGPGAFLALGSLAMPLAMALSSTWSRPAAAGRACPTGSGNRARGAWCSCS